MMKIIPETSPIAHEGRYLRFYLVLKLK